MSFNVYRSRALAGIAGKNTATSKTERTKELIENYTRAELYRMAQATGRQGIKWPRAAMYYAGVIVKYSK